MREDLARIVRDLGDALRAEADLPSGAHVLAPRAAPRSAPAGDRLLEIADAVRACTRCPLCRTRTNAVPGEGSPQTPLMVIGEAPGATEDRLGRPFVGAAGNLLDNMLKAIQIARDEVYITNVLKCRPPGNRDPEPAEKAACRGFLMAQIAAIRPKVILALGRHSAHLLLNTTRGILSLRGTEHAFEYDGGKATLLPMVHPAYLLKNPAAKRDAWEDMQLLHRRLREATGDWPPPIPPRPAKG